MLLRQRNTPEELEEFTQGLEGGHDERHLSMTRVKYNQGQAAVGFEPTNNGFAIRPLSPLGYTAMVGGAAYTAI